MFPSTAFIISPLRIGGFGPWECQRRLKDYGTRWNGFEGASEIGSHMPIRVACGIVRAYTLATERCAVGGLLEAVFHREVQDQQTAEKSESVQRTIIGTCPTLELTTGSFRGTRGEKVSIKSPPIRPCSRLK